MKLSFAIASAHLRRANTGRGGRGRCGAAHGGAPAAEQLDDEQVLANRMVHDVDHPAVGPVRVLANPGHLDGNGFVPAPITPAFGSEVRDLLAGAGLEAAEIDSFIADGVTRESIEKK